MANFRQSLITIWIAATLVTSIIHAQTNLSQILDTIKNPDGSLFNGTVVITWNGYSGTSNGTVSRLSTSAQVYNGALSVLLVPTTTASPGTYYQAVYGSSDGTVSWAETWQVPPSTTALTIAQVRQTSTLGGGTGGGGGGGGGTITLPIAITDVSGLQAQLTAINTSITGIQSAATATNTTVTGLNTSVTNLSGTVSALNTTVNALGVTVSGNTSTLSTLGTTVSGQGTAITTLTNNLSSLTTTVGDNTTSLTTLNNLVGGLQTSITNLTNTVNGLAATVNSLSASGSLAVFVDGEIPSGTVNGINAAFSLANTPAPAMSLNLFRNGLEQLAGSNYSLNGSVITFAAGSFPQTGDTVVAYYRQAGTGAATNFTDNETPGGTINGTNLTFTLASAPNPALSLRLFRNGVLLALGGDYTLSGSTITFTSATTPRPGDSLVAQYRH